MSYNTIAAMVADLDLRPRLYACAGREGVAEPQTWVDANVWRIVANAEMEAAYAYAQGTSVPRPGRDEGVISDAVILAHVQPLIPGGA